ncbi:rhodanese-like domain-containing protein [Nocardia farcinica]|uniref:rhodanese-like domain-containing protein n=1 Tax=Nocardia farcinica TaxID=37329 RepID=UPI001E56FD5B|nr:rhodanese-like domain-containing protein [Nocardia farcinica]
MSGEPPALPARLHPLVRAFLDDRAAVAAVADSGTPAHVVFPQVLAENVGALAAVLDRSPVRSRMCYAHKVNRSPALARAAERCGIGIDVASPGELANARAAGFAPARIEVTGPKGARFLATAVASGATINVDNLYAAALQTLRDLDRSRRPPDGPVVAVVIVCDRLEPYLSYIKKRRPDLFGGADPEAAPTPAELAAVPRLTPAELADRDRTERLTVVDTRGAMAYRIGHVPGAINLRDDLLDDMLAHGVPFPRGRPVVFVCPVGEVALRFAVRARRAGYDAASLDGGVVAWRDAGLPWERG